MIKYQINYKITNCTIRTGKQIFAKLVGQDLQLFTKFPYRVSCLDQQGQMDPLITETTDENESKMRPITTRAWLISLFRPLHARWTHAHISDVRAQLTRVDKENARRAHRDACKSITLHRNKDEGKLVINFGSIKLTRSRAALQGVSGSCTLWTYRFVSVRKCVYIP